MSNVPPPPPSYPFDPGGGQPHNPLPTPQPGWIPGSELPGAAPATAWPSVGQAPPPYGGVPVAPAKKPRPPWIVPAAIVAVVAIGVAVWLATKSDGSSGIDTSAAKAKLDDALAQFDLDAGGQVALTDCEGIDIDQVAKLAPKAFDADSAVASTVQATAFRSGGQRDPVLMQCLASDGVVGFSVGVGAAPRGSDFGAYLDRIAEVDFDPDDEVSFEGGTMHPFCFTGQGGVKTCETAWTNSEIQIEISAAGDGADRDLTTTWVRSALAGIVADLADMDPNKVELATG